MNIEKTNVAMVKKLLTPIYRKIQENYDSWDDLIKYGRLVGKIENKLPAPVELPFEEYSQIGHVSKSMLLVATSSCGLLLYHHGKIFQLFDYKGFYGITKDKDAWYAFHKTGWHGRIIRFKILNHAVHDCEVVIYGLSRGVHQIDIVNDQLMIADTYNNRIIVFDNYREISNAFWRDTNHYVSYPNGRLQQGRKSENYNHFNSIFASNNSIFVVAHNETYKTGKYSELYILDNKLNKLKTISLHGSNCHNYFRNSQDEVFCKSLEGTIVINNEEKFQVSMFTRGLSISPDLLVFGGSTIELIKEKRGNSDAKLFFCDKIHKIITEVKLKKTQVNEIRRVDTVDQGLTDGNLNDGKDQTGEH
jgi:hypothetical protein